MQGDWRDYRDTCRERVETPRTQLPTALHFWRASPRATTRTSRPRLLSKNRQDEQLAGVEATFSMRGTGSSLLASTPPRPGQHGGSTVRKRKEESAKQAADAHRTVSAMGNGGVWLDSLAAQESRSLVQMTVNIAKTSSTSVICMLFGIEAERTILE